MMKTILLIYACERDRTREFKEIAEGLRDFAQIFQHTNQIMGPGWIIMFRVIQFHGDVMGLRGLKYDAWSVGETDFSKETDAFREARWMLENKVFTGVQEPFTGNVIRFLKEKKWTNPTSK
jgi:hypothetical protein